MKSVNYLKSVSYVFVVLIEMINFFGFFTKYECPRTQHMPVN